MAFEDGPNFRSILPGASLFEFEFSFLLSFLPNRLALFRFASPFRSLPYSMQPTSLCSPSTISQSSTPTPRSLSRSQNLTPLSLLATPSPSLAPAAISSFASDFEEARDDPIDALQGSLQPFFMSRSHEIEPPPQGLDGTLLDPTEISQPSITSTWERYDNRNDGSSWSGFGRTTEQRIEGFGSDRERDPRDPTHLAATGVSAQHIALY